MATVASILQAVVKGVNGKTIRLEKGDLTALPVDAFVFYAREDLELGSGFGSAITARGGAPVKKELERIGRIGMGQAVITTSGGMRPRHIVHACGPKFQESDVEPKLRACVQSALDAAAKAGFKTVAFPPMGAGFYGVPLDLCATVMVDIIQRFLEGRGAIEEVVICVIDNREFRAFQSKLQPS
jgi:O-acetyl-ADP-ribose deacetylase (regulator of RNase III)